MRIRSILLTSAASVGLFLTLPNLPDAHAQRGTFLSPQSQWAVTKVAGNPAAGQAGYCAVAKRYEGNAILTIARNQGTETSFALDLQKPSFNPAQLLSVTLDPGAGEQRDYSISPASGQAFVVRLGRDEAFFNAIDRTGLLRVEVADSSYVFNISDIGVGQSKLNSCLAAAVQPAAGDSGPVSFGTQVESASNKAFINELQSRIASLEGQNQSLEGQIARVESRADSVARAPKAIIYPEKALKVEQLRAENLRLKAAIQTGELELRSDKLSVLEADNARLKAQVSRTSNMSAQVAQLQNRIDALLEENARLQDVQSSVVDSEVSALEFDIQQLEAENQSLKVALADQSSNDVSEQLRVRIEQIESENRVLKEQVKSQKQASYQSKEDDVQSIRAKHAQEVASLYSRIEELRMAQNNNTADDQLIDGLNGQLASLRADNLLLQQELHEKAVLLPSLDPVDDTADIAALEFENKKLKSKIDKSLETHALQDRAIVALEQENVALKTELASAEVVASSVDQLTDKLAVLTSQLSDSQKKQNAYQAELASLELENSSLKDALDGRVSENLALAEALNDVSALKDKIAIKDAELAEFDAVPERLQSLLENYQAAKAQKENLERENARLKSAEQSNAVLVEKLAAAEAMNDAFESKLSDLQDNVVAMSALNAEVKTLQLTLAEKETELEGLSSLRKELEMAVAENAALKASNLEVASVAADETLVSENIELRRTLSSALDKIAGQNEILEAREDSISSVLAKNEALKGQLDLAAQLMASSEAAAAEVPLKKATVKVATSAPEVNSTAQEAKVILASAAPAKPKVKPSVVRKQKSEDISFAETLAQIEPAAGDDVADSVVEDTVEDVAADVGEADSVHEASQIAQEAQDFMDRDLNQAQIYEEQLKRSLNNKELIEASRAEPIDVETLEVDVIEEAVSAQSDIDALVEDIASPEELPTLEEPEAVAEVEAVVENVEQDFAVNAEEDAKTFMEQKQQAAEAVEMKMSQDPFEGIEVKGEDAARVASAPIVEQADDAPLPQRMKQPKSSPVAPTQSVSFDAEGRDAVERVLQMANVSGASSLQAVNDQDGAYQWRTGALFGSGEQREMSSSSQFDGFVKDYLSKTEARCPGDFAIVPDNSKDSGSLRVDSYEIACIGDGVSSTASLVFYNQGNVFTVLAHETEADKMAEAMAVRDQIFASLASGRDS